MITSFFVPKGKARNIKPATPSLAASAEQGKRKCDGTTTDVTSALTLPGNKRAKSTSDTPSSANDELSNLLGYLHDITPSNEETEKDEKNTWRKALNQHFRSFSFGKVAKFVAQERKSGKIIYPPPQDVFSALNLTPFPDVKLVIIGQDPYHGPQQAHGLCFSVRKGVRVPPSLQNMYKELSNDPDVDFPMGGKIPQHGFLERWAKQGVLMLNTVLTVRGGQPNSHQKKGWENFTDEIVRVLDRDRRRKGTALVFLLWGKPASKKVETALTAEGRAHHKIICSSHPSPLGASKTKAPFLGSRCFSRANTFLEELGHSPIDWNVDGELPAC